MSSESSRVTIPPVMLIHVEDSMDIMIARNTARRAASLLGFSSASRAQIASAVATLIDIILNADAQQTIHLHGIREGMRTGLQVSCDAAWLSSASPDNALIALKAKLGEMMDEVKLDTGSPMKIRLILWLLPERAVQ